MNFLFGTMQWTKRTKLSSVSLRVYIKRCVSSEKDIEDDHYLVPCALYEAAMVHLSTEHFTEAKDLLTRAKYGNLFFLYAKA